MGCVVQKLGGFFVYKGSDQIQVGSRGKLGEDPPQNVDNRIVVGGVAGDLGKALQDVLGVIFAASAGDVNVIGGAYGTVGGKSDPSSVFDRLAEEIAGVLKSCFHLFLAVHARVGIGGEIQDDHRVIVPGGIVMVAHQLSHASREGANRCLEVDGTHGITCHIGANARDKEGILNVFLIRNRVARVIKIGREPGVNVGKIGIGVKIQG